MQAGPVRERLAAHLLDRHPADAARLLERFPAGEIATSLQARSSSSCGAVLAALTPRVACAVVLELGSARAAVLDVMPASVVASILRHADERTRSAVLSEVDRRHAQLVEVLLSHGSGTAAAHMDSLAIAVRADIDCARAVEQIRTVGAPVGGVVYVVDGGQQVRASASIDRLVQAPPGTLVGRVAGPVHSVSASATVDEVLAHPGWAGAHELAVLDAEGRLAGVIRYSTLRRLEAGIDHEAAPALSLALNLGELFWFGLSGLLDGMARATDGDPQAASVPTSPGGTP